MSWLQRILPALERNTALWSGPRADAPVAGLTTVKADAGRRWLGQEVSLVVWDGWQGNPPDSMAALSGTVRAGGLWFWLMPPLDGWTTFADPDYRRTGLDSAPEHPFAGRMAKVLAEDPAVIRLNPGAGVWPGLPVVAEPPVDFVPGTTEQQQALVTALVRIGQGRRRRPLVVTADRGRGKSAALGIAAIALLRAGRRHIAVTAPAAGAVATLFAHARQAAGLAEPGSTGDTAVNEVILADGASLRYYPPDVLVQQRPPAELVLVDEAAGLPSARLREILLGWPRCVFATTVHGYEGAGRGFAIRFREVLERETPQWQHTSLSQPIRWAEHDPLERLTARLFLLHAQTAVPVHGRGQGVQVERWDPASAPESELAQAFGLLVDAHYRTTPGDLRQWLDDPGAMSWRVFCDGTLAGVLWASREGGLSSALARQVMLGKRRLRGHLLAQTLANHSGFDAAACLQWLRVVRVAVNDRYRRRGLGALLVAHARQVAAAESLDGIGTSYGASPDLLAFWQRCGFQLVRCGLHRETSSGEYAVQMVRGISPAAGELVNRLRQRFADHWLTLLPLLWRDLPVEVALALTRLLPAAAPLSGDDLRDLASFTEGFRGFELTVPVLRLLARQPGVVARLQSSPGGELWCRAVLQGWNWAELQAGTLCAGRRDGDSRLRALTAELRHHPASG
ncbi:tRNA(Met) cytidine acetyltransferase TmcA [Marinobacter sp. X15-166B]|uniref:tRNA(Met) cytidine acetyltransferase TmcA n=1 Tax=Marinobacter sp. X15-166B TaxID=1897620 RepID=UPI000AFA0FFE|nr:GNAT family N-acetyltransferase [Marinobacter sp. X15-166B]